MTKKIGVDLGGTNLRVGVVEGKRVIKSAEMKTPATKKELLKAMIDSISSCMEDNIKGIGVACPGPLKNGVVKNTPNIPLKNFNLKKFLEKKFRKRTAIENDAKCVALSELKFGIRKKNFLVLTFGTGIGGGIVINSNLYKGRGNAGELGHIVLGEGEDFERHWQESRNKVKKLQAGHFVIKDLLDSKDVKSVAILGEIYRYCGEAVASLINAFNPEAIVFMGGARESGNRFLEGIKNEAKKHVIVPDMPLITWSKLKHPGILGASLLID
jgi:glucokinase